MAKNIKIIDGDEKIIATAKHILKNCGNNKKHIKEVLIALLSHLGGYRYDDLNDLLSTTGTGTGMMISSSSTNGCEDDRFKFADPIARRKRRDSLRVVDEIVELNEECSSSSSRAAAKVVLLGGEEEVVVVIAERVKNVLRMVMSTTEDDFRRVLRDTVPIDAERMYGPILNHSFAVYDLKELADRMIKAGYEEECRQVYTCVRRDVIDEFLSILGVDKLDIELAHKIDDNWGSFGGKMNKWSQAMKVVLTGEKQLCDKIFSGPESELLRDVCFGEISRSCIMQLITFAEKIICTTLILAASERLFRILDIYDALADVLTDLQAALLSNNSSKVLCIQVQKILDLLGVAAKVTVDEFENVVKGNATLYMMDFVNCLVNASNYLLSGSITGDSNGAGGRDDDHLRFGNGFLSFISSLESGIEEQSKLYEDMAMKYVFLMKNNIYLVHMVTGSKLGKLLGDQWVRKHHVQIRQYAACFLRACSCKGLSCLKGECVGGGGGSSVNVYKMSLKDKVRNFISSWTFRTNASAKKLAA